MRFQGKKNSKFVPAGRHFEHSELELLLEDIEGDLKMMDSSGCSCVLSKCEFVELDFIVGHKIVV